MSSNVMIKNKVKMTMGSPSWRRQNLPTHAPAGAMPKDTHPIEKGLRMTLGIALIIAGILVALTSYANEDMSGTAIGAGMSILGTIIYP